ncbi:MAG: MFS transporter [Promethearchaeota archaeon]
MEETANEDTFKDYLVFWSGQLFSLLGSTVVFFVIVIWIAETYHDPMISAFAIFLYSGMMAICLPFAGVIADRLNRKVVILVADSLQAFATFILILLFQFKIANIWIVFIFISLRSAFQAFHLPTVSAIIPIMVPKDKLSRINGINFLFTGVVQLLAPLIGAILLLFLPFFLIFWVDIITFFIAVIPLLLISIPSVKQSSLIDNKIEKSSFFKEFRLGIKTLKMIPGIIILIVLSMFLNFILRPIDSLMVLYILDFHRGTVGHVALVEMLFTGGMISGAIFTSIKKNWNKKIRVIFISLVVALVGYFIFAIAPSGSFYILGLGGIILGFNMPIINALYQTFIQETVPANKLGRVTSIDYSLSSAISPLGSLFSGSIAVLLGIQSLFIYCSLIGILCTIGTWTFTGIRKVNLDSKEALEEINEKIENMVF